MKFVIRKVPERDTSNLEAILPDALVYSDVEHKGALASFEGALRMARDDACYIQDDMILGRGFREKAEYYISLNPNDVIVFSNNTDLKTMNVSTQGYHLADKALWLLCTYIPNRIAIAYLSELDAGS